MPSKTLWSVVAVAAMMAAGGAAPAFADSTSVSNWTDLTAATSATGTSSPVTLGGDVREPTNTLQVQRSLTLDLDGNDLDVLSVTIAADATLTIEDTSSGQTGRLVADASSATPVPPPNEYTPGIDVSSGGGIVIDSGHITATGGNMAAGIGSANLRNAGPISINGGTVIAAGGETAAGIGGGNGGSAGTITITDGDVTATGGMWGAGIGGGFTGSGGHIAVNGGTVTAVGGENSAGIGDGSSTTSNDNAPISGSDISIGNGTVTATGGDYGAGIGGGLRGAGVTVDVSGGTVAGTGGIGGAGIGSGASEAASAETSLTFTGGISTATGGTSAAAVGGGASSAGATTMVGTGAVLITNSDTSVGATAFGAGKNTTGLSFGSVSINGTVRINTGDLIVPDSNPNGPEIAISATGRIEGPSGVARPTLVFSGTGQIMNQGVIAAELAPACTTTGCTPENVPDVTVNNYLVTFDSRPASDDTVTTRLLAPSFAAAGWALPTAPELTQWSTVAAGAATPFTSSTAVTGDTTVVARAAGTATITPQKATATAGTKTDFTVVVRDAAGDVVTPASVVLSSSNHNDTVNGLTVTADAAGSRTITASVDNGVLTTSTSLQVTAAPALTLTLTSDSDTVDQGGSLHFTVAAQDAFGNPADTSGVVLTSSMASDVVNGLTVRFPHASTHVITATLDGVSTSVSIRVKPAPTASGTALASTGSSVAPLTCAALILLLAGAALWLMQRKRLPGN